MLYALRLAFTASTTELGRTGSTLVGRAQESTAGLRGTRRHKEALLFGFLLIGFRTAVDVAPVSDYLTGEIAQHYAQ